MTKIRDVHTLIHAFRRCDEVAQQELLQLAQNFAYPQNSTAGTPNMTNSSVAFALHILERAMVERLEDGSKAYEDCEAALAEIEFRLPLTIDLEQAAKTVWAELNPELIAKATQQEIDQTWSLTATGWLSQPAHQGKTREDFFKHWLAQPEAAAILGVEDFSVTL